MSLETKIFLFDEYLSQHEHASLFTDDIIHSLKDSLSYSNLIKLSIKGSKDGFRLNDGQIFCLTEAMIKANIQLADIALPYHMITDVGLEEMARLFQSNFYLDPSQGIRSLEGLNLEGNEITGSCLGTINLHTAYDCPILYLNLSNNPLGDEGRNHLANIVSSNKVLQQLSINRCGFTLSALINLTENLVDNTTLQLLYIDRPLLSECRKDEVADHLSRVISHSTSIHDISIRYFNMLDHGAKLLANALCTNFSLISLNLECNNIGITGTEAIASYLLQRKGNSIKSLFLSHNKIRDDGAIALAEVLTSNTCLAQLTIKNNSIGPKGLQVLGNALRDNAVMESLSIFGNNFDDDNGKQYLELINNHFAFTGMYVDVDVYIVDGKYLIAEN